MQSAPSDITVVLPTLNAADYLDQAVSSLQAQTLMSWELIIVDGGSNDGTAEMSERFAAGDERISFIRQKGMSLYRSIFTGFDAARSDMLCWMGADDLYPPWGLEAATDYLHRPDTNWIMGQRGIWDSDGLLRLVYPNLPAPRWLIRSGAFNDRCLGSLQAESIFFRRSLFKQVGAAERARIESLALAGDHHLWKAFAARAKLTVVPTLLGGFRLSGSNRSVVNRVDYEREVAAPWWLRWSPRFSAYLRQGVAPLAGYYLHRLAVRENSRINCRTDES